jgi:NhaP-type Na+/H+ or K+/H+ antiporter
MTRTKWRWLGALVGMLAYWLIAWRLDLAETYSNVLLMQTLSILCVCGGYLCGDAVDRHRKGGAQ